MGELACRRGVTLGLRGSSRAGLLVRLLLVEGLSVQPHRAFSARPHFRGVGVSARLQTAPEVPLVDFTAVEVLLGDFMEVEVTAKLHGLFPNNYPYQYSELMDWEIWHDISK